MSRRNLKIQADVFNDHNEKRNELGLSWTEYLRRCEFEDSRDTTQDSDVSQVDEREIAQRITSDLVAQLPPKIADELR